MREVKYKKIDAFTSGRSLGNPAACIYLEDDQTLSHHEMLMIAKQHKGFVSEIVYCTGSQQSGFSLVYYSSECEVDFCGHGTIACMYSLIKSTPSLLRASEIIIHTKRKGTLIVYNRILEQDAVFITAPKPVYIQTELSPGVVALNLGLAADRVSKQYPIYLIDAGLATLIVPIVTLADEINVFPDERSLKEFCLDNNIDIILIFSLETESHEHMAHTRVFAPKFGYLEDPATGSGNSAFGYYLLKNGIWKGNAISLEQGGADIEFNTIRLTKYNNALLFGGSAKDRIVGKYCL